jgi:uncharacterized protein
MIIDLRTLGDGSGHLSDQHEVRFEDAFGEDVTVPVTVDTDYRRAGGGCYLSVSVRGRFETSCHRCLVPVGVDVEGSFEVVVRWGGDEHGTSGEDEDRDYIVLAVGEHEVDVGPSIHENFVVNVPMLVLCEEDCKGLCSRCGTNLNEKTCDCSPDADPRWDALRALGEKRKQK